MRRDRLGQHLMSFILRMRAIPSGRQLERGEELEQMSRL